MKNSIFKVAAVIMTVISVSFAGMSIAAYFNNPEPLSQMVEPVMQDYTFEKGVGQEVTWTVKKRFDDKGAVGGTFNNAYDALARAHEDLQRRKQQEASDANALLGQLKDENNGQLAVFRVAQSQDEAAMKVRHQQLEQVSQQLRAILLQKSEQLQALSVQSKAIRDETAVRRTDVIRLLNELEEARTDLFRLNDIKRVLTDRLVRLQLENQALNERQEQLETQVSNGTNTQI